MRTLRRQEVCDSMESRLRSLLIIGLLTVLGIWYYSSKKENHRPPRALTFRNHLQHLFNQHQVLVHLASQHINNRIYHSSQLNQMRG